MSEPLNIESRPSFVRYLRAKGLIGDAEEPITNVLSGGVSNRTVLLQRAGGQAWVVKQALEQLRVAVEWFSSPERITKEALGLRWLGRLLPPGTVPALIFEDAAEHLLVMEAVQQPSTNWKTMLLQGHLERDHIRQFAELLSSIHASGYRERDSLCLAFADTSFFESLRLEPYYEYTASRVPSAGPFLRELIASTRRCRETLVHGDFSPKNILVHQGRLVLLDHEAIHFGDPAFDVGFSMTHLLSKAHHLGALRERFREACRQYWDGYRAGLPNVVWRHGLESRAVQHTLGCLLARVAGRSPLEYLAPAARFRQEAAVVAIIEEMPESMEALIGAFLERVDADDRKPGRSGSPRQSR
ncbi:MAG: phosphotransferase family protein [Vicinamibacteraceae bacterium]